MTELPRVGIPYRALRRDHTNDVDLKYYLVEKDDVILLISAVDDGEYLVVKFLHEDLLIETVFFQVSNFWQFYSPLEI